MKVAQIWTGKGIVLFQGTCLEGFAGEQLMVTHLTFAAGALAPLHSHPHEQITLVLRGSLAFSLGDEHRTLVAGEAVSVPGHTIHGGQAIGETELLELFTPVRQDLLARVTELE